MKREENKCNKVLKNKICAFGKNNCKEATMNYFLRYRKNWV